MTATQKFKTALVAVGLLFAVIVIGPKLAGPRSGETPDPRPRPTLHWQGTTVIQYARPGPGPDLETFRKAERDPDKAILYVSWKGNRTFRIEWTDSKGMHVDDPVLPAPSRDDNGFTTWAVVIEAYPGLTVRWRGIPRTSNTKGFARCDMYHRSKVAGEGARTYVSEGIVECTQTIWA